MEEDATAAGRVFRASAPRSLASLAVGLTVGIVAVAAAGPGFIQSVGGGLIVIFPLYFVMQLWTKITIGDDWVEVRAFFSSTTRFDQGDTDVYVQRQQGRLSKYSIPGGASVTFESGGTGKRVNVFLWKFSKSQSEVVLSLVRRALSR